MRVGDEEARSPTEMFLGNMQLQLFLPTDPVAENKVALPYGKSKSQCNGMPNQELNAMQKED